MRSWLQVAAVIALLMITPLAGSAAGTSNTLWVDFPVPAQPAWSFVTHGPVRAGPAVVDGTVYVGSDDGVVYAVDLARGQYQWSHAAGAAICASPVVADGRVYVGTEAGRLLCLQPPRRAGGPSVVWCFEAGAAITGWPLVTETRLVVFGTAGAEFIAVQADSGEEIWRKRVGGPIMAPVTRSAVSVRLPRLELAERPERGELLLCSSTDGRISALAEGTGEEAWTFNTGGAIEAAPVTVGKRVYVGNRAGNFYCLEAASGRKLWHTHLPGPILSSAAVGPKALYVGTEPGSLHALTTAGGAQLWRTNLGHPLTSPPILIHARRLFVASADGALFAVAAASGQVLWQQLGSDPITSSPVIVTSRLLYGTEGGRLNALRPVVAARLAMEPTTTFAPEPPPLPQPPAPEEPEQVQPPVPAEPAQPAEPQQPEPAPAPAVEEPPQPEQVTPPPAPEPPSPPEPPAEFPSPTQPTQPTEPVPPQQPVPPSEPEPAVGEAPLMVLTSSVQGEMQLPVQLCNRAKLYLTGEVDEELVSQVKVGGKQVSVVEGQFVAEVDFGKAGVYPLTIVLKRKDGTEETLRRIVIVDTSSEPRADWAVAISPDGDGHADEAYFTLFTGQIDEPGAVCVLEIRNPEGKVIQGWAEAAGKPATFTWDGKDQWGELCPDGDYSAVFILKLDKTTFTMSQKVVVRTK